MRWCTPVGGSKGSLPCGSGVHAPRGSAWNCSLLQAAAGHWVTVGFNTPPAGPRTPGTEPGRGPCREDTGLRGSGTLLRGPGCGGGGWGAGGAGGCCCCSFFLLIFLSFALRFWNQILTCERKGGESGR